MGPQRPTDPRDDVHVIRHGPYALLNIKTEAAEAWVGEHYGTTFDYDGHGVLVAQGQEVEELIEGMRSAGLVIHTERLS